MKTPSGLVLFVCLIGLAVARLGENVIDIRRRLLQEQQQSALKDETTMAAAQLPSYNFSVPIDHFHNDSRYEPHMDGMFNLRYWFDSSHYEPGGPVILLEAGEAPASDGVPILRNGILYQLAKATNGVAVLIEHRYYGTSQPMPNLSTENLRFLTTEQAMADNAYFAQNIVFPGLEQVDLTSNQAPWILWGGSYPGAFVAISRMVYPNIFWGAISSSGVTRPVWDNWEYNDMIRRYGPPKCMQNLQFLVNAMDNIFMKPQNKKYRPVLKNAFGLGKLVRNNDFMAGLNSMGAGQWQSQTWLTGDAKDQFDVFCLAISSSDLKYPATERLRGTATKLLAAGGYMDHPELVNPMLNWIGFMSLIVSNLGGEKAAVKMFNTHDKTIYDDRSYANQELLSWHYQTCTQWGMWQTGSSPGPELPIVSRLIDIEFMTHICRVAFNVTTMADTASITKYGGFDIKYPRLAIVDGEADPWRPMTPHARAAKPWHRPNTVSQPFHMIGGDAIHAWDAPGVSPSQAMPGVPPLAVANTQAMEAMWVQEWVAEWRVEKELSKLMKIKLW